MTGRDGQILKIRNVAHSYGSTLVLDVDHWSLSTGGHCLVKGPSGSGKSTLLHVIAGLMRPNRGEIVVDGQRLDRLSGRALDRLRGRKIGIVLQNFHLIEALDVLGNLDLAQSLAGAAPETARTAELLETLGLAPLARKKPAALSQGERQRVAIARAVINRPVLLLADEPTSALDDGNANAVLDLLIGQADAAGATLLMASHDARAEARLPVGLRLGAPT